MVYLPFEYHFKALKGYVRRGYTLQLMEYNSVLHPKTEIDHDTRHVIFHIDLTRNYIRTQLESLITNRERYVYKGRIDALFNGTATEDIMTSLGLTIERLGTEGYVQFLKRYRDGELTNQYVKPLILPFSPTD